MLIEAFLGLIDAGILKREVDGVMLHGAFFLGPKVVLSRAARDAGRADRAHPDDAGVLHQRALWRRGRQAARARRCALRQQRDDGDPDGGGGFRRPRRRPGRQRRRRPVQFRGAGVCAGGRALDPRAGGDTAGRSQGRFPTSAGTTATRPFRGICATSSSPNMASPTSGANPTPRSSRRCWRSRIPAFRTNWREQAKDAGKLPKNFEIPRGPSRELSGADRGSAEAGARSGAAAVISVRQRFHRRSNNG